MALARREVLILGAIGAEIVGIGIDQASKVEEFSKTCGITIPCSYLRLARSSWCATWEMALADPPILSCSIGWGGCSPPARRTHPSSIGGGPQRLVALKCSVLPRKMPKIRKTRASAAWAAAGTLLSNHALKAVRSGR